MQYFGRLADIKIKLTPALANKNIGDYIRVHIKKRYSIGYKRRWRIIAFYDDTVVLRDDGTYFHR